MGNKTRPKLKKLKNRGGEKLNEWRILREFGSGSTSKLVRKGKKGDNVSPGPDMNCSSNLGCTPLDDSEGIEREYNHASNLSDCLENVGIDCNITSVVEQQNSYEISGRRIVDIAHVIKQFKEVGNHAPQFGCTFVNMDLISERKRGLRSGFLFKCNMCGVKKTVWSEDDNPHVMDINSAAVAGVLSSGGGFANLEKILGAMNIWCMNHNTFDKHERIIAKGWEQSALEEMRLAAEEEKTLAKVRGDVDQDGVPLLTVVADGSWAKRSYRTTYNSLSGVGAQLIEKKLGLVGNMWTTATDGSLKVKKIHNYHLQVQGQLNITGRKYCLFTIWTPQGLRVETIWKDEKLWEEIMKPKLDLFYKTCLLPELIDPRQKRHMPLREPEHILTAIENKRKSTRQTRKQMIDDNENANGEMD